ncbi:MAG: hypothetical protein JWM90_1155 [Thermoleophilia bacterium]|nr:hypothetical protein [Thermoleophilia bacterium]
MKLTATLFWFVLVLVLGVTALYSLRAMSGS